ncbi:MAG: malate synthase A [Methylotenera sp.]|nr:malate synthase A [Oligoflexia bacterium]
MREIIMASRARFPETSFTPQVLTPDAVRFLVGLHDHFNAKRLELLGLRRARQVRLDAGELPDFLQETETVRTSQWQVAEAPADLQDRRVEITGPVEAKMMINALNSGAKVFMADFEDSLSPTWNNVIEGQLHLQEAVRRSLKFVSTDGRQYQLNEKTATLVVRPRGWHLEEAHFVVDGQPMSASLFDFGLHFFHNAHESLERNSGPYYYLPKMESHLEGRLWNDVFNHAQSERSVPQGSVRATVLIETILAAFEMEEILFELKEHCSGLNAGRWDYIFSIIKKFSHSKNFILPDRSQVTMTVPFMRSYAQLLVQTCHKRGAHAMGGMSAFIPSRKDAQVNEMALRKVREDKEREASDGFDGTWVAHPDLVPVAAEKFDRVLENRPHQKTRLRGDVHVNAQDLLNVMPGEAVLGTISAAGLRTNVEVALIYLERWISGQGAVAIHNLMEDAATAEISRAQVWQWIRHSRTTEEGRVITFERFEKLVSEEMSKLQSASPASNFARAGMILTSLVKAEKFPDFLTVFAYHSLNDVMDKADMKIAG